MYSYLHYFHKLYHHRHHRHHFHHIMFAKDASSVQSAVSGKKGKDIPLRKSDRRAIRQRVGQVLLSDGFDHDNTSKNDDGSITSASSVAAILDVIFLQGTLQSRQVITITNEKATLYLRSPSAGADIHNNDSSSSVFVWPYTDMMQVVWTEIDHGPQQPSSQIPTLALCSVLPPDVCFPSYKNSTTTASSLGVVTISHHVSKFLCRGAHLMRSGILTVHAGTTSSSSSSSNSCASNQRQSPFVVLVQVRGNPQPMAAGWLC